MIPVLLALLSGIMHSSIFCYCLSNKFNDKQTQWATRMLLVYFVQVSLTVGDGCLILSRQNRETYNHVMGCARSVSAQIISSKGLSMSWPASTSALSSTSYLMDHTGLGMNGLFSPEIGSARQLVLVSWYLWHDMSFSKSQSFLMRYLNVSQVSSLSQPM